RDDVSDEWLHRPVAWWRPGARPVELSATSAVSVMTHTCAMGYHVRLLRTSDLHYQSRSLPTFVKPRMLGCSSWDCGCGHPARPSARSPKTRSAEAYVQ